MQESWAIGAPRKPMRGVSSGSNGEPGNHGQGKIPAGWFVRYLLEDRPLHGGNVLLGEVSPAQLDERGHAQLVGVVELAGQVERRHRNQLKGPFVDRTLAEVAVQIREGYGDDLPVVVKVVDDLVGPLADFGPPVLVDAGGGGVGSDGVGRRCG